MPEVAKHVAADDFDFFLVGAGAVHEVFGNFVFKQAMANGDDVALMNIALEEELGVFLADFIFSELEVDVLLVGFADGLDGGMEFEEVSGGEVGVLDGLEEAVGDDGIGSGGEVAGSAGIFFGVAVMMFDEEVGFIFFVPALVAVGAPVGEVLVVDGFGSVLFGEDGFDGGEPVEPREDAGALLAVEEAAVELFADVKGKSGDFAGESFHS